MRRPTSTAYSWSWRGMCTWAPAACSRRISSNTEPLSSRLDSPRSPAARMALATSDTGRAGTTRPTSAIRCCPSRSISAEPLLLGQRAEVDAAPGDIVAERKRLAEADAGVAVAVPSPPDPLPQAFADPRREHQWIEGKARALALGRGGRRGQDAVLEHAVVVEADGHEDDVAGPVGVEARDHVAEQPELRRPQRAVARQAALGEHGLGHAGRGRHVHVARQHLAIERIRAVAAHEIAAHGADQALQRPHAGPFADGVAQRRALRHQIRDQHVVHVGAMVDDEHHRGVGRHLVERHLVEGPETHAIERGRELLRQCRADPEIGVGRERRHDLLGVAAGARMGDALGLLARLGLVLHGLEHVGIEHQLLDQLAPSRQLEGRDLQLEPLVELVDRPIDPPPQPPPHRRREEAVDERDERRAAPPGRRARAELSPMSPRQASPPRRVHQRLVDRRDLLLKPSSRGCPREVNRLRGIVTRYDLSANETECSC